LTDEKFTWPADMPRYLERGWRGTVRINGRRKDAWILRDVGRRSIDDGFAWVLNTAYDPWGGWLRPTTRKSNAGPRGPGNGTTTARCGLISRRGYIRIIREDIPVIEREEQITELKTLAAKVLHSRNATIFERHVIAPLQNPLAPKPSIADSASQFGISPRRVKKIIYKAWKKIETAKIAADAKEQAPRMTAYFAAKRSTGGITYQHQGQYWDANQIARSTNYTTSINSAATAASTRDIEK